MRFLFFSFLTCCVLMSCDPTNNKMGNLNIEFKHFIDDNELYFGSDWDWDAVWFHQDYVNKSINYQYNIRRALYVLSDIILYFEDGSSQVLDDYFFINTDDPSTFYKSLDVPGVCSGISFRIGFSSENNIDNYYINDQDNFHALMLWPNLNGVNLSFQGGYHYMKVEGKYLEDGESSFYNAHTGPINAQDYSILIDQLTFPATSSIVINVNLNNFFNDPLYDISLFGSAIMDNVDAQSTLSQNGTGIFSVEILK
jgi:hypothetical protein